MIAEKNFRRKTLAGHSECLKGTSQKTNKDYIWIIRFEKFFCILNVFNNQKVISKVFFSIIDGARTYSLPSPQSAVVAAEQMTSGG